MNSLSLLRLGPACLFTLQLVACASQPSAPTRDVPPADSADPKVYSEPAPPVLDEPPPPPAKKQPPPTVRNQGFGPYDSLERLCGTGEGARCLSSEPVRMKGSSAVLAIAQFEPMRMGGTAALAFETRDGWFVSEPPREPFGGGLSHHSPASTDFLLDQAEVKGDVVSLLEVHGSASFIPGRGSEGSTRSLTYQRLACRVSDWKVVCGPPVLVYSERCQENDCKSTGVKPRT